MRHAACASYLTSYLRLRKPQKDEKNEHLKGMSEHNLIISSL